MNIRIEEDEEMFFDRLQDMQLDEQDDLLRRRINELKSASEYAVNNEQAFSINRIKRKLQAELHRVSQVNNRRRWSDAVRHVYGNEGLEQVLFELERMSGFPYAEKK